MGFFQSLKEDLSSSVNDMINADGLREDSVNEEEITFLDGEPLLSDEMVDDGEGMMDGDFSSASYEQNIDDLLNTLKTISEENEADNSVEQLLDSIEEPVADADMGEVSLDDASAEETTEDIFSVRDALNSLKHASRKRDEQREMLAEETEPVIEEPVYEGDVVEEAATKEPVTEEITLENIEEDLLTEQVMPENESVSEEPQQLEFDFDSVLKATITEEQDTEELSDKIVAMVASELEETAEETIADEDIAVPVSPVPVEMPVASEAVNMISVDDMPSVEAVSNDTVSDNGDPVLSELLKEYQDKLGTEEVVSQPVEESDSKIDEQEEDEIQPVDTKPVDSDLIMDEDEVSNDTAVITSGMSISGDINSNGNLDILGSIKGDIRIKGKLNVAGSIDGDSVANEVFVDGAEINGNVSANGSVKVGAGSVIIGDITARGAVIAGAVKGEIDVQGPVILDSSAIVMGNIKSMTVQINNGAVIEGMCSQCYAPVNPVSFFDELKKTDK